jgi:hypothetical protein
MTISQKYSNAKGYYETFFISGLLKNYNILSAVRKKLVSLLEIVDSIGEPCNDTMA